MNEELDVYAVLRLMRAYMASDEFRYETKGQRAYARAIEIGTPDLSDAERQIASDELAAMGERPAYPYTHEAPPNETIAGFEARLAIARRAIDAYDERRSALRRRAFGYRYEVGTTGEYGASEMDRPRGSGYSWEEALANARVEPFFSLLGISARPF